MRVSFNLIRQYTDIKISDEELIKKIGEQLGAVEEVIEFGKKFEGALIAKVISCDKHPNADRLSVCLIDDGGKAQNVQRDQNGKVIVVCGAPNVHTNMTAVWLPPGATVPSTYDKDPFVLDARELRGVVSNGMLASAKELDLSDDHSGIVEIDKDIAPGTSFAEHFNLKDDTVINIENKMFTHRPDLFGQLGVAREIAGIQHEKFEEPDWYLKAPQFASSSELELNVENQAEDQVKRFMAVVLKNIEVKPSPLWLQVELARLGSKSINNVVDITNYVMLLTAQPTHAYDYDKLEGNKLVARLGKEGETVKLLNNKVYELNSADIVIADAQGPVGLGGIMGGGESEVSDNTINIVLEVANFDMYTVRRSSMRHGIFTDALTRFSKGQSPLQNDRVMAKLLDLVKQVAGGEQATDVSDLHKLEQNQTLSGEINISANFINDRLGSNLNEDEISNLLSNVSFKCENVEDKLAITAPFWRTDIELPEDIVEEVGRLYSYDRLPLELPKRATTVSKPDQIIDFKASIRQILAAMGANEVLNYSFVHGNLINKSQQSTDMAYEISNALSPDLQYYRMSLTPGLLNNIHPNIKAGYDSFALFELGKLHNKLHKDDGDGVPKEFENLSFVFSSKKPVDGAAFYQARKYLDDLAEKLGIVLEYKPIEKEANLPVVQPFDIKRSALVCEVNNGIVLGIIGEFKPAVRSGFKLPDSSAGFEIGIGELMKASTAKKYEPLSRYPAISQDICLQISDEVSYGELYSQLSSALKEVVENDQAYTLTPIDLYTSDELVNKKRITFRIKLTSYSHTLTENVLSKILEDSFAKLKTYISAERI